MWVHDRLSFQWEIDINTETHKPRTDFQNQVLDVMKSDNYSEAQKKYIYSILSSGIEYEEKVLFIIAIDPHLSEEVLHSWHRVVKFLLWQWISGGFIEKIVDISSIDESSLRYLESIDCFSLIDNHTQFIDCVMWCISQGDTSIISDYIVSKDILQSDIEKNHCRLRPISFRDFQRKIRHISQNTGVEVSEKPVGNGGVNFCFLGAGVINIWSGSVGGKNIYQQQQKLAIKYLWCSRQDRIKT